MSKKLIRFNSKLNTNVVSKKNMHTGKVNGKDLYQDYHVIENVTHMMSGTVMNGIRYGKEPFNALANYLTTTNARVPAPLSHPSDKDGGFMDANDPLTFSHNIGAFDTDWRVTGDRLVSNTYIPVDAIDNPKPAGEWLAKRFNEKQPIDRSTGLYLLINEDATGFGTDGEPYQGEVTQIVELNHSALLDPDVEPGAKGNAEGAGMFTNSKGEKIDVSEADLEVNASTPALRLPLAPADYVWNEAQAIERIKAYTNSETTPSTSYRKFFLNFNQDDVTDFASYTNAFADIIDGVPHAVKQPLAGNSSTTAQAYNARFAGNKAGMVTTVLNAIKSMFKGNELSHDQLHSKIYDKINENRNENQCSAWPMDVYDSYFIYRAPDDKIFKQPYTIDGESVILAGERTEVDRVVEYKPVMQTNSNGDSNMQKLIAILNAANIKTDGLDDDAILAAYNSHVTKPGEEAGAPDDLAAQITNAVNAAIAPLQAQLNASTDKELTTAVNAVVALNKGIDETAAKAMGLVACNAFLAANGHVAFNANTQQPAKTDGCNGLTLPNVEA